MKRDERLDSTPWNYTIYLYNKNNACDSSKVIDLSDILESINKISWVDCLTPSGITNESFAGNCEEYDNVFIICHDLNNKAYPSVHITREDLTAD